MIRLSSPAFVRALVLCALCASCGDHEWVSPPSGSGGFAGNSPGKGFVGSGGSGIVVGGTGPVSLCSPSGGPVDVGSIGGPGRDGKSNLWTVPYTANSSHLTVDAMGDVIVSMRFATLSIGGTYYSASYANDTVIAKFDPNGNVLWSRPLVTEPLSAPPDDYSMRTVNALATDSDGNIFVAGSFSGVIGFGGPELSSTVGATSRFQDAFLVKLDPMGGHVFSKKFGDANEQSATLLAVDAAGNVTVAGRFGGIVDFGGEAFTSTRGSFGYDVFVAQFDANGEHLQSTAFGAERDELVTGLALDSAANTVVFGHNGAVDDGGQFFGDGLFLHKFDAALAPVYEREYPSNGVTAGGLSVDAQQNAVFVAALGNATEFQPSAPTPLGIALVKLDPEGNPLWQRSFDDLEASVGPIGVDDEGNILLSGGFADVDFGGGKLVSAGSLDAFVAKFDPDGNHVWSQRGGCCSNDFAEGLQVGPDGSAYVVGSFADAIAFSAKPVRGGDEALFVARFTP